MALPGYTCNRVQIAQGAEKSHKPEVGIEPGPQDLKVNTLPRRCKGGFYRKAVEVCYIPSPLTFSPTKLDFVAEVPGHRESFLMRIGELLPWV